MSPTPLTTLLDRAILGLIAARVGTGYDVRKVFQDTPLGMYSDSPGSIYPALRRLQRLGLIAASRAAGPRRRRVLRITVRGREVLVGWLTSPLTYLEVARATGEPELRLAFLSDHADAAHVRDYMRQFAEHLGEHATRLAAAESLIGEQLSPSAHLAFGLGLATVRARAGWCARAATSLSYS